MIFRRLLPEAQEQRILVIGSLANAIGAGIYFSCSVLLFRRLSGLSPNEIGLGLTLAGIIGLLAPLPFGILADRYNLRTLAILLSGGVGLGYCVLLTVGSFATFLVAVCFFAICLRGNMVMGRTIIARMVADNQRTKVSAYLRAVGNGGLSVGAAIGGTVLYIDTSSAYYLAFGLAAACCLITAAVFFQLPHIPSVPPKPGEPRLAVLRDRPYAMMTLLNTILLLYIPILNMILPLWIVMYTQAPGWTAAIAYWINTVAVMSLQVVFARHVSSLKMASNSVRLSAVFLAAACSIFAAAAVPTSPWLAISLVMLGSVFHVLCEMTHMAGAWEMSFALAPPQRHGQYQGFFSMASATADMMGPLLLTQIILSGGTFGWLALACVFLASGWMIEPIIRWASRTRGDQQHSTSQPPG